MLLVLNEAKRPARLLSDALYQLHAETWYRYAFIAGGVLVKPSAGERYVLLLTTDADRNLNTLDNKPFKRPLQALAVNEAGCKTMPMAIKAPSSWPSCVEPNRWPKARCLAGLLGVQGGA